MEEKFSCHGPPLQWTFLSRCSPYHTNVHFTGNHSNVTVPITLKRLMTVSFSVHVGLYSSSDGNLWKTIIAKIYEKGNIVTKLGSTFWCSSFVHCMEWDLSNQRKRTIVYFVQRLFIPLHIQVSNNSETKMIFQIRYLKARGIVAPSLNHTHLYIVFA